MFTGLVRATGRILTAAHTAAGAAFTIEALHTSNDHKAAPPAPSGLGAIALGDSIACAGVCLTVTAHGRGDGRQSGDWFSVQASPETLARTTARDWTPGALLNLEPALRVGDALGGHWVSGHVDGVATVKARSPDGDSLRLTLAPPVVLNRFLASKGSVTVDGVSLTVNGARRDDFDVAIIPHTAACTTLRLLEPGGQVNIEVDVLARYAARLLDYGHNAALEPAA